MALCMCMVSIVRMRNYAYDRFCRLVDCMYIHTDMILDEGSSQIVGLVTKDSL